MTEQDMRVNRLRESWKELVNHYKPCASYIKFTLNKGTTFTVTVDGDAYYRMMGIRNAKPLTYIETADKGAIPMASSKVSFDVDFGERLSDNVGGIRVNFPTNQRIAHPNVFDSGKMCTGGQSDHTTFLEIVEKALRVIVFDPNLVRLDSMACNRQVNWYKSMVQKNEFPTVEQRLFFKGRAMKVVRKGA